MALEFDFEKPTESPPLVEQQEEKKEELQLPATYDQFLANAKQYEAACQDALGELNKIQVTSKTSPEPIVDTAALVARINKAIKAVADERKRPHQQIVNEVNAAIKKIKDIGETVKSKSNNLLNQIRKAQRIEEERLKREAEEADRRMQEALKKEAKELEEETGQKVEVPELPKTQVATPSTVRTDTGATGYFKKDVEVVVTNMRGLMAACLDNTDSRIDVEIEGKPLFTVDFKLLKDLYKAGRRDIPFVKFTEVEVSRIRT